MRRPKLIRSRNSFRFADAVYDSLGKVVIRLKTPTGQPPVFVEVDVVSADIPPLLGMDLLDRESLTPCTISNRLIKRIPIFKENGEIEYLDIWSIPLTRAKSSHLYEKMDLDVPVFFTRDQLSKLHRQFHHPSSEKLFKLLSRSRPDEATPETLEILKDINKRCDPCQRITNAPRRFKVTLGSEHIKFNERIQMDLMYIDSKPILHIIDEGTKFSAAQFIPNKEIGTIWDALIKCWAAVYTGLPNRILVDQGSEFGNLFVNLAAENNVQVQKTGIESHSSLGLCERFHGPLRNTFRKVMKEYPKTDMKYALAVSVKALNDTLGPEGFVPSSLVFGEYPQMVTPSESRPSRGTNMELARIANFARNEMETIMAHIRLKRSLNHTVPPAADRMYEKNDQVLIWREKIIANRIGEWMGPYIVESYNPEKKLVSVIAGDSGRIKEFNVAQVKPYYTPELLVQTFFEELLHRMQYFTSQKEEDFDIDYKIFLTEVFDSNDVRCTSPEMKKAKLEEIHNLIKRGTFKAILKEDVPKDGNVLPGRFVLAIKSSIDGKIKCKARFVIGGHRDKLKKFMVHSSSTLQPHSNRLLLTMSLIFKFKIWTSDVRQAYLQSLIELNRDIYLKNLPEEFDLPADIYLKLLKPLYGLCDSGDLWCETLDIHHRKDLDMKPFKLDHALYYYINNGKLKGLSGSYIDDIIRTGDEEFKQMSNKTNRKFEMAADEELPSEFTGFIIKRQNENIFISQSHYLQKLSILPKEASFSDFRSMRMRLAWLSNSRPDCLFHISKLTQVTEKDFNSFKTDILKQINTVVEYAKEESFDLKISKLENESIRIVGFSDSSFANNRDLSSQLGYIILIMDKNHNAVPIYFKSYKSRRITRSPMAGEVIAFSDMFDVASSLSFDLSTVLMKSIPIHLFTDSKCLFDAISKGSRTSEKRIMIDISAAREGFKDKVISNIGFVRSQNNIADALTKDMKQKALRDALASGKLEINCEQWIIRRS